MLELEKWVSFLEIWLFKVWGLPVIVLQYKTLNAILIFESQNQSSSSTFSIQSSPNLLVIVKSDIALSKVRGDFWDSTFKLNVTYTFLNCNF